MKTALLLALLTMELAGQTRVEELAQRRFQHASQMTPEATSRTEEFLRRLKDDNILQRINYGYNGLGAKFGGLVTGSGFALGPQYVRDDLKDGALTVRASTQISFRNYQKAEAQMTVPKLLGGKLGFDLRAGYVNYPSIEYYGPGPDSSRTRSNFRLENWSVDGAATLSPFRFVRVGGAAGLLKVNVGPGQSSRFVSAEQVFSPAESPGIDRQSSFFRYGTFAQFDYRDDPFGPRNGGSYVVQFTRFEDRDLGQHDFNLVDVDLQQYFGLLNRTKVIALRARTRLTSSRNGQSVPFYLQPIVGGSDDLRGFRPFRFSGNNSLVLNGEYRWAIFSGCDGALFIDAGKVFSRRGQLNFNDLEASAGFGLRFNARNRTFMRFDVGFSHEGFQAWFKFNDVFQSRPLGTADSQPVF